MAVAEDGCNHCGAVVLIVMQMRQTGHVYFLDQWQRSTKHGSEAYASINR